MSESLAVEAAAEPDAAPSAPRRSPRGFPRFAARVLVVVGLSALGFVAVLYTFQANVIFPGAATQGRAEAIVRPGPGEELVRLTAGSGDEVVALYGAALSADGRPTADASARPALVFFYGNAMCMAACGREMQRFRRLGLNVLIPDYLGYGMSGGKPSEIGCRQTATACYNELILRGFPARRILIGGWSLGGAVAIDLASREPAGGLFAFSTFTSIPAMSRKVLPLPLPRALFKHPFDSLSKLPEVTCPVLLGHGRIDPIVPFSMFESLAAATRAPLSKLIVDRAGHNDFFDVGGRRIDEAVEKLAVGADRAGR